MLTNIYNGTCYEISMIITHLFPGIEMHYMGRNWLICLERVHYITDSILKYSFLSGILKHLFP